MPLFFLYRFTINFQTGLNKYDDIAFHFNPWIGQRIYSNSFQNGNWEVQECVPDDYFTRGASFSMFIVITTDGYEVCFMKQFTNIRSTYNISLHSYPFQVYMNDFWRYTFQHRIPLEKVTTLGIWGDVSIEYFGLCEVSKTKKKFRLNF